MIILLITLCTSPSMDDCQVHQIGSYQNKRQCEVVASIQRDVLGTGPDQNYRLQCVSQESEQ